MRSNIFALPLLALGGGVLASRCVPRSSSGLTISSTPTLSTPSTESSTVLTPITSTATPSISSTESSESTTPSVILSTPSTESTHSTFSTPSTVATPSTVSTSSAESTPSTLSTSPAESTPSTTSTPSTVSTSLTEPTSSTTSTPSAEPTSSIESTTLFTSTFTSSTAQATSTAAPQQPNLLTNSGFEDSTVAPWKLFRPSSNRGQLSIATDPVYEGSQSGNFQYGPGANSAGGVWGIYQSVSGSGIVANDPYQITARIRVAPGACPSVFVGGTAGSDGRMPVGQVTVDVAAASVGWVEVTTTVQYNQATISSGPGVGIISYCSGPVSFWVDNVALRKAS